MMTLVDEVLPTGRGVGAINAVRIEPGGRWVGDMFDGKGFVAGLRKSGHEPGGKRTLLVGAGGAGSALAYALAEAGVSRLTIHDVDHAKAERLALGVARAFPEAGVGVGPNNATGYELVCNATPIGMRPGDPSPIDPSGLKPGTVAADVIILADDTPFLAAARARGCAVMGVLPMTLGQAEEMAKFLGMTG